MLKHSQKLIKLIGIVIGFGISSAFAIGHHSGILKNLECGIASTYSSGYQTANGEHYNHLGISAAHKHLPFGTRVIVRHQRSGKSIMVRINDRGPFIPGRIIDLSTGAKNAFGMGGLAPVCLEIVSYGQNKRYHAEHHHRHAAKLKQHQHHKHHVHVKHKHHHKRIYREDQA
jgi:rare lipoprotein A